MWPEAEISMVKSRQARHLLPAPSRHDFRVLRGQRDRRNERILRRCDARIENAVVSGFKSAQKEAASGALKIAIPAEPWLV